MYNFIRNVWYKKTILSYLLFPFSLLYRATMAIRRFLYHIHVFHISRVKVPVIVVGNITVGGTGKTPLVITLVHALKKQGFRPGIITRGYGGNSAAWPQCVVVNSDPFTVGDEAVLLAKNTDVLVVAGPNRVQDANLLIEKYDCNVIVSDDGLQHLALARDFEIAVVDGMRRVGNGFCLPAGPLREPQKRLKTVDLVIINGDAMHNELSMCFVLDEIVNVQHHHKTISFSDCHDKKITAMAGIGNPERFFRDLKNKGLSFSQKIFPDHYAFKKEDIEKIDADLILMTEKDAIKCKGFDDARLWFARGHAIVDDRCIQAVVRRLMR